MSPSVQRIIRNGARAVILAALAIMVRLAFPQAVTNPSSPTSNPNQINVTSSYLYLNKMHYAGTWSSGVTYNSQDLVFYSGVPYISLLAGNIGQMPSAAPSYWAAVPASAGGTNGQIQYNASGTVGGLTMAGDCTFSVPNITCTKTNGSAFSAVATSGSASDLGSGTLPHGRLPALLSGDIPNNAANTSGNAATASALAATPTLCPTGQAPTGVTSNGNATGCASAAGATTVFGTACALGSSCTPTVPAVNTSGFATVATSGSASSLTTGTLPHAQLPALLSGDIPNNAANTSGNAATASALAATPTLCPTGQAPTGVTSNGNATGCAPVGGGSAVTTTIAPFGGIDSSYASSVMLGTNNLVWYAQIYVPYPLQLNYIKGFQPAAGNVGHMAMGVYDSTCTLVGQSTSVTGAGGQQSVAFPFAPLSLVAGSYYVAFSSDNSSSTFFAASGSGYLGYVENTSESASTYRVFNGSNHSTTVSTTTTLPSACGTRTALNGTASYFPSLVMQ